MGSCNGTSKKAVGNFAGCKTLEPKDSADFKHLKYSFYKGKDNCLYEKKFIIDKFDSGFCQIAYFDKYLNFSDSVPTSLDSVINLQSFVELDSSAYSKDKKNVYYYQSNTDGGARFVTGADPRTFEKLYEYRWGRDAAHIYYEGVIIAGLNIKTFVIMPSQNADGKEEFADYMKDDKHVFCEDDSIPGADSKTFIVVKDQKWDAQDKNYKYIRGERWKESSH